MGMKIEVTGTTYYTVDLTDEDVQKVKNYLKEHGDNSPYFNYETEKNIAWAVQQLVNDCEIELFTDGKAVETEFITEEIYWSEFEGRTAEEILSEGKMYEYTF